MQTTTTVDGSFGVRLATEDLDAWLRDSHAAAELQQLLDRYMVLVIAPQREMTKPTFGALAFALGFPEARRHHARGPTRSNGSVVPDFEFVADFGADAKPSSASPRAPSYIESLHYDGISAYSMQATFNVPEIATNQWCDMRAAYRDLPARLRSFVDTHAAWHAVVPPPNTPLADFPGFDAATARRRALVIKHPRTREPLLYLPKNPASTIEGMPDDEGRGLLDELWTFVEREAPRYRAQLRHNELVVWDGLGTVHTNPPFPREKDRTIWFLVIPGKSNEVEAHVKG